MSISINTNVGASLAAYNLGAAGVNLRRSMERLSSGSRINSSFDDAGGLAVSMKLSASIRRTDATLSNVNNAISFLQTQDGALGVADKLLNRMSELTVLAMDVTKTTDDLTMYNTELGVLQEQLYDLCDEEFNGIKLFDPGAAAGAAIGYNAPDLATTLNVIISEDGGRTMGITQADLDSISWTVGHSLTQNPRMKIDDKTNLTFSLGYVTQAINSLGVLRAYNGAQQTQLNHSLSILSENKMNLEAANSRIQDVDVASESAKMASEKIRYEAATAMLAQANQSQQSLLRLIL